MKYPDKVGCAGSFGFVVLPATITKPKDSPSGNQFEVATSGGADDSAFCTTPPKNITVDSTITTNRNGRILFSFLIWSKSTAECPAVYHVFPSRSHKNETA
jgi:hypothetical protein